MIILENASLQDKLKILADAAKYDVACTSSGVERSSSPDGIGSTVASGICHSFAADGRCISLLKILFTNECVFDCKYCVNRCSNDVPRVSFTPEEVCELTMEFYKRNYIEGLFLSSGILHSPDYTMEQIILTLRMLRETYHFGGYIHCKTIPGSSPELVELAGWYADRMSINLELPTADGLRRLAPNKTRTTILRPMRQIQLGMAESQELLGMKGGNKGAYWHTSRRLGRQTEASALESRIHRQLQQEISSGTTDAPGTANVPGTTSISPAGDSTGTVSVPNTMPASRTGRTPEITDISTMTNTSGAATPSQDTASHRILRETQSMSLQMGADALPSLQDAHTGLTKRGFVPAGQSTQMIIGASGETDLEIMAVSEALYRKFDLKRVFYSAFLNITNDAALPATADGPPLKREHRLYQADWLLRYYGFEADELLSPSRPNFNVFLDPKCDWALGHLEHFPVEINRASYDTLLRVPGIGVKSASRIVKSRRTGSLDYGDLKKIGVVLKRAIYFITCNGRMFYRGIQVQEDYITRQLLYDDVNLQKNVAASDITYRQMNLFDFVPQ